MSVYTYTDYTLVEESEEYEYKNFYLWVGGNLMQHLLKRRSVHTMTWEATLTDALNGSPAAYDHEQGYPGSTNPGNLSQQDGWRLLSVEYTKGLSTPMSKDVRETWVKTGNWETVEDLTPSNN